MFFVRSTERRFCPCCGNSLKVAGSRPRRYNNSDGDMVTLIIRRLRCSHCERIHHELPDILVPYKRHSAENIEAVLVHQASLSVPADQSTLQRWKSWFAACSHYLLGALASIAIQQQKAAAAELTKLPRSVLQRFFYYVGDAPGWLARIVQTVANANYWQQTRYAFLS